MKTIVYFTSDTCKPCKFLLPKVTELMKDDPDLKLVIVPIDTRDGALKAQQAGVMTVPTLLFPEDDEIGLDGANLYLDCYAHYTSDEEKAKLDRLEQAIADVESCMEVSSESN